MISAKLPQKRQRKRSRDAEFRDLGGLLKPDMRADYRERSSRIWGMPRLGHVVFVCVIYLLARDYSTTGSTSPASTSKHSRR